MAITMKSKALANLDVAQGLINQQDSQHCTASIHCSYYAVFQYMKYMLAHMDEDIGAVSYEEQTKKSGKGSHEYILLEIRQRIKNRTNAKDFAEQVRALKQNRVVADYDLKEFSTEESLECMGSAKGLISKLKTYFGNI